MNIKKKNINLPVEKRTEYKADTAGILSRFFPQLHNVGTP